MTIALAPWRPILVRRCSIAPVRGNSPAVGRLNAIDRPECKGGSFNITGALRWAVVLPALWLGPMRTTTLRRTTSSVPTSATRPVSIHTTKSARPSISTRASCSWTTIRLPKSLHLVHLNTDATNYTIPCNDSLLSAAQANTLCGPGPYTSGSNRHRAIIGRRDFESGGRVSDITHEDYRIVFGSKGDIGQGWTYDISMQYGRSVLTDIEEGNLSKSKTSRMPLDVGADRSVRIWTPVRSLGYLVARWRYASRRSATSRRRRRIRATPRNKWLPAASPATLASMASNRHFATDGVGVSFGAEYRREYPEPDVFDSVLSSGDVAGGGGNPQNVSGSQSDKDVFGEIRVPIDSGQAILQRPDV